MAMTQDAATTRIIRQLAEAEQALDCFLAQNATLVATVVQASLDAGAPVGEAQAILMRLARTQQSIVSARSDLVHAHSDLLKVGQTRGSMPDGPCPPAKGLLGTERISAIAA